ncbi:MAG: hypothetical protein RIC06_00925 [Cyclobacteriaceae bacterium]
MKNWQEGSFSMRIYHLYLSVILGLVSCDQKIRYDLTALETPIIFKGDAATAYRDPAVLFHNGLIYMYFTLVEIEPDGRVFSYTAFTKSNNLLDWDKPIKITPRDQNLNYCSPGNVIRVGDEWILCLQTYPRPNHHISEPTRYGNKDARVFIMRSKDLQNWSSPELLRVKGDEVPEAEMGRMIDPYLLQDKDDPEKWWCFYKQNGASMSYSRDLKDWTYFGSTEAGENVTVLVREDTYWMIHSPKNGIGIKQSKDLKHWEDWGELITLGQANWDWAKGRLTAATVVDLRQTEGIQKYLMFFHGSGPMTEEEGDFDRNASIGIAWSDDLIRWEWPQQNK